MNKVSTTRPITEKELKKCKDLEKEVHFKKFGFEVPDFECELFYKDSADVIIGRGGDDACFWDKVNGKCFYVYTNTRRKGFDLAPLKKEWYEKESAFPAVVTDGVDFWIVTKYSKKLNSLHVGGSNTILNADTWRLATNEEIDSLKKGI